VTPASRSSLPESSLEGPGDAEFTAAFLACVPALYAWTRLRLDGGGVEPEDVLQEVWLRGAREFERFDPARGPFRAWLFQVTKSTVLDALRNRAARVPAAPVGGPRTAFPDVPAPVTPLSRRLARDEALVLVLVELQTRDGGERDLVVLCGLVGRTTVEAARVLGIGEEAARKQWQRLRARLGRNTRLLALIEP
jgi:RNA polymerase sigma-70 factor (ECF subfamily)